MNTKFSLEQFVRVYCDDSGDYIEVSPDGDGLDLLEIRSCDKEGKIFARITMPPTQAGMVREAIAKVLACLPSA